MSLRKIIGDLKTENGLTTDALSAKSGVPKGTINKILNGETRNPTIGTLAALAEALGVPLERLTGRPEDIPGVYRLGRERANIPAEFRTLRNAYSILPVRRAKIPLVGEIAAGRPIYAEETFDLLECDPEASCDFALRVHGDSMIGARIRDGDIVFIRRQEDVEDGQIAAVIVDDEATLKRVYHIKNGLQLLSENPKYPPMVFTLDEYGSIRILGRAVSFTSAL